MIIGVSEGDRSRFEVVLMSDGVIVRASDIETGAALPARDRMFRTAQAAFAFAELSALEDAEDRTAMRPIDALEARMQSDRAARHFSADRRAHAVGWATSVVCCGSGHVSVEFWRVARV